MTCSRERKDVPARRENFLNEGKMEILLYGKESVEACLEKRPAALREIFTDARRAKFFGTLREAAARERRAWTEVSADELSRIAGTRAHGGIAARTERPEPAQVRPAMRDEWSAAGEKIIFLENVSDPAQLASIARVAAICGVTRVVADERTTVPALANPRAWSLSGGAFESLRLYRTESPAGMLRMMGERFFVVGFAREGGRRIDYAKPPAFPGKPAALLLSGDPNGVPAALISRCGHLLHVAEPAGTRLRYTPAELAAHALPWLFAKTRRAGTGFLARKKGLAVSGERGGKN